MTDSSAPIAITMGEPAGIGGELTLLAWQRLHASGPAFFAIDAPGRLEAIAAACGWPVPVRAIATPAEAAAVFRHALPVVPVGGHDIVARPGQLDRENAGPVLASIEHAVALAQSGAASAIVTNPIQKSVLYAAGFKFPGHTEYLGALCGVSEEPVMMLATQDLRVVPVTIHLSLREAIANLNTGLIVDRARITASALRRDFGIAAPRLAVLGLNPHAGEDSSMGTEDRDIVAPAIAILRRDGIDAFGPMPPDTAFTARARKRYDAAICMYHDQGLIPLKTLDVDGGVNVTLGLPIVRTSPDHGTALDIAGQGVADPGSLIAAILMAASMAQRRKEARA